MSISIPTSIHSHATPLTPTSFAVISVGRNSLAGDPLWTVLAFHDIPDRRDPDSGEVQSITLGGDHHWVRALFADRAERLYQQEPRLHGMPSGKLGQVFDFLFGGDMFSIPAREAVVQS